MYQHWVPASYLRAWCDPDSEYLQNPYVWRFSKDGSEVRAKSPQNLFRETDMYTFTDQDGRPDLAIEQGLSRLEDRFERLRRDKIMSCQPMGNDDKATFFLFVATARFRTRRSRGHWKRQLGKSVELGDRIAENIESLSSEEKAARGNLSLPPSGPTFSTEELRALAEQPLQLMLPIVTESEAGFLSGMTTTILCTPGDAVFITSDAPVVWFDPELYKMPPFYRNLALGYETIQVTMPIAPSRLALITHAKAPESYIDIPATHTHLVDDYNRRTRFHCDDHFVSNSSEKKEIWFDPGTPPPSSFPGETGHEKGEE